jgi:NTP pyrophosphatase (non-canonical NTP hydrolase)
MDKKLDGKFLNFQKDVNRTWTERNNLAEEATEACLGFSNEASEVASEIEKWVFRGKKLDIEIVKEELGDTFYYFVKLLDLFKISLTDIMKSNVNKRKKKNKHDYRYKNYLED